MIPPLAHQAELDRFAALCGRRRYCHRPCQLQLVNQLTTRFERFLDRLGQLQCAQVGSHQIFRCRPEWPDSLVVELHQRLRPQLA